MSPKTYPFSKVVYAGNNAATSGPVTSFSSPNGLTTDSSGNPWVCDTGNQVIKRFTPTGFVTIGVQGSPGLVDSANEECSLIGLRL
jgi:sugar lactone lactonase YvrE